MIQELDQPAATLSAGVSVVADRSCADGSAFGREAARSSFGAQAFRYSRAATDGERARDVTLDALPWEDGSDVQNPIHALIAKLAARETPRTEAMIQADVRQLLLSADLNLSEADVHEVALEAQVGDRRRIDVEVGATVIEVKKDLRIGQVRPEAVKQLRGYVEKREETFGRRYVGVLTDGAEWRCYALRAGELAEVSAITVSATKPDVDAFLVWLEGVLATARDLKPTPQAIRARLGAGSSAHALDRATLAALFAEHKDRPEVKTKRRLWARLLETALGTQFQDSDDLFVEHTLLVNSAEIIAHAVLGLDVGQLNPTSLLSGDTLDHHFIFGVVEADFFDWVVDLPKGEAFVRTLARRLARFDWAAVEHDVLKILYESVITAETRKKLGEYYTPDWLAEQVVEATVANPLEERVLDPACGSGTFVFHSVRRYLAAAEAAGMPLRDMLAGVTTHVIGMDLHPVAVTLARVTYVLAIGRDRLSREDRGVIQVPVFLGDSIQWRQKAQNLWSEQELKIPVDDRRDLFTEEFKFPNALLRDSQRFDELVKELATRASNRKPTEKAPAIKGVLDRFALSEEGRETVTATYTMMCRLHDEGRDHIWGYYIRNLARPEWLARKENRVDVLVGNPPWLAYRFMPSDKGVADDREERSPKADMQQDFRDMSMARNLWHGSKVATHQDLSALFVARAVQLYLKPEGRFGFVMPSAVLDRAQYKGFRAASYDGASGELRVKFKKPWDLRRLRPHFFPISACVVFGARAATAGKMPTSAEVWTGRLPGGNASWADVAKLIKRKTTHAADDTGVGSPYKSRFRQGASIVPRMLFMVTKKKAGPLGMIAGKVSVESARSANEKKPWKNLPAIHGVVESEFIRSVHLGETVLPYRVLTPHDAVIPRDTTGLLHSGNDRIERYPGLSEWWRRAEQCWEANRAPATTLTLAEQLDFHGKLSGEFPIQPQRIVYSKSGMHLAAARLEDRRAIIDHTLYWATAASVDEAHYLCAMLNAAIVTKLVRPLMAFGKDERHVDKYVWKLPIPMFDPENEVHRELAALGKDAEKAIAKLSLDATKHFAASRRAIRQFLEESEVGKRIEVLVEKLLK